MMFWSRRCDRTACATSSDRRLAASVDGNELRVWNAVTGATKYTIQVDSHANFSAPVVKTTVTTTTSAIFYAFNVSTP